MFGTYRKIDTILIGGFHYHPSEVGQPAVSRMEDKINPFHHMRVFIWWQINRTDGGSLVIFAPTNENIPAVDNSESSTSAVI